MKKAVLPLILCFVYVLPAVAQNIFGYDKHAANDIKAGIFASLSVNSTSPLIKQQEGFSYTAKGALSTVPTIGGFMQVGIGERFSFRGSLSFGYSSYAYKYAQTFDSLTDNYTPVLSKKYDKYTKVKHGSAFVMPQVDLGYLFGPFKKIYLVEVRAGIGFHAYLKHDNDSFAMASGGVTDAKSGYTYKYNITEKADYGQSSEWGTLVGNFYVGLRWQKTYSEFLNHFSAGIQATIPVYTQDAGYSQIEYKNESYQVITRERVDLGLFNFGIRLAYSFL